MKTGLELLNREERLSEYAGADKIVSSHELDKELSLISEEVPKLFTGLPSLDRILDGVEAGELILVTGPTGEGKTTLLMSITQNMAEKDIPTCWFTLEVTPRQFIKKIKKSSGTLPLFYLPNQNDENTINWLEERIVEATVKYGAQVVFIDHIHSIFSLNRVQSNISLEIGDLVTKIKDIALKLNIVVFLIAHCRDGSDSRAEPRKQDIRDSGLISRIADSIIGVWRIPNDDDGMTGKLMPISEEDTHSKVAIMKNRREGKLGFFLTNHVNHHLIETQYETNFGDFGTSSKTPQKTTGRLLK